MRSFWYQSPRCVTGYAGTFDAWVQAEIEWRRALEFFEVSEFHLTDFLAREQEFKNDWSDQKRSSFMERFCTIASERPMFGVGCGIRQEDWENGFSQALGDEWKDPYYFCIYGMLSIIRTKVLRDSRRSLPLPLYFMFDNKPKFEGTSLKVYREYQKQYDPKARSEVLGEPFFVLSVVSPPGSEDFRTMDGTVLQLLGFPR